MGLNNVENVSLSLICNFLSKKGLKESLNTLVKEYPSGVTLSYFDIIKELCIEDLCIHIEGSSSSSSLLELIISNHMENKKTSSQRNSLNGTHNTNSMPKNKPNGYGDLILEDTLEGETFAGDGLNGVLEGDSEELFFPDFAMKKHKSRGIAAPITNNTNDFESRRPNRFRAGGGRPLSSRLNKTDVQETTATTSDLTTLPLSSHRTSSEKGTKIITPESLQHRNHKRHNTETALDEVSANPLSSRRGSNTQRSSKSIEQLLGINEYNASTKDPLKDLMPTGYDPAESSIATAKRNTVSRKPTPNKVDGENEKHQITEKKRSTKLGDVEFDEIDDDMETELNELQLAPVKKEITMKRDAKPITQQTAIELKKLMLGSALKTFPAEWLRQGLTFSNYKQLKYGIVQKKGGPCGILSVVQAYVLYYLLFADNKRTNITCLEPTNAQRSEALSKALCHIVWKAGQSTKAIIALPGTKDNVDEGRKFKHDGVTEKLMLNTFSNLKELQVFMSEAVHAFECEDGFGVVLILYSAILSRSIPCVRSDMDELGNILMGAHAYCTQDLVNLLLTGQAVSNVFNDTMELDSGGEEVTVLKGVNSRSDIGLMSLFEHYKSCQVGTYLKTPRYPIWVVCSESHFSVLFSLKKQLMNDWRAERNFHLYYYDGLAGQNQNIKLTVDTANRHFKAPADDDLIPPLELCIRTKWADAEVDWNGTEPLL